MKKHNLLPRMAHLFGYATVISIMTIMPASAHIGLGSVTTLKQGFLHPLSGIDHTLAMLAVGIYAANLGGRALWLVPSAFVGTMILGGLVGYSGPSLALVEEVIGISVVAMGFALAMGVRLSTFAAMALVGVFAFFHGHAHGSEGVGLGFAFLPYACGFVIATALLHAGGVAAGLAFTKRSPQSAVLFNKVAGSIGVICGVSLLAGWISA